MKSKAMLVLLVPLNRYVCFPASGGTVSFQSPGFGLACWNTVTLDTVVFPTEFPRGSLSVIFGELFSLEIEIMIFSIVSSTTNLYSLTATLRFFLRIGFCPGIPFFIHTVSSRSSFVKFFNLTISAESDFGRSKT